MYFRAAASAVGLEIALTPETRGSPEPPPWEPEALRLPQPHRWAIRHGKPWEQQGRGWGQRAAMGFSKPELLKSRKGLNPPLRTNAGGLRVLLRHVAYKSG